MRFPNAAMEATEEACAHEPLVARTRMALLRLEKDGHRAGWDQPANSPTIFKVEYDPGRHFVTARPALGITQVLDVATLKVGGDVGEALMLVASVMEHSRQQLTHAGMPVGHDLFHGETLSRFYGFAMRNEGWSVDLDIDAQTEAERLRSSGALAAAEDGLLHRHPDRIETRMVHLVARDGLTWWVLRLRRRPPVQAIMMRPEADLQGTGLVLHALGRMTAAMVGNVVPIPKLSSTDEAVLQMRRPR